MVSLFYSQIQSFSRCTTVSSLLKNMHKTVENVPSVLIYKSDFISLTQCTSMHYFYHAISVWDLVYRLSLI